MNLRNYNFGDEEKELSYGAKQVRDIACRTVSRQFFQTPIDYVIFTEMFERGALMNLLIDRSWFSEGMSDNDLYDLFISIMVDFFDELLIAISYGVAYELTD